MGSGQELGLTDEETAFYDALAPEEQSGWRLQQRCAEFWSERPEEQPYQQCWREWVHPGIPTPGPNERP